MTQPTVGETAGPDEPSFGAGDGPRLRLTTHRLRRLGRPFRRAVATTVAWGLAAAGFEVAAALATAAALDRILAARSGSAVLVAAGLALTLIGIGFEVARQRSARSAEVACRVGLRRTAYRRLAQLGAGYLGEHRTGAIETTLTEGVDAMAGYYADFVPRALAGGVTIGIVVVAVAVLDPLVGLIMAGATLVVVAGPVLSARAFGASAGRFAASLAATAAEYLDAIQGIATLQSFDASRRWAERLAHQQHELAEDETALEAMATMHVGFTALAVAVGTTISVAVAVTQATHHHLAAGPLLAILVLGMVGFRALSRVETGVGRAYRATALAEGIFDLFDAEVRVADPAVPRSLASARVDGAITFDHVTFGYGPDRRPALADVSFTVAKGELLAVVGPSGAGKSTLVSLLLRFFDPDQGRILLDGHDLAEWALADLRSMVAVTFQDTYLFNRSVADNLRLARPTATDADLQDAARAAHAHDFILGLPAGYDTVVGERGRHLSGGQRQRVAIAAALLSEAPILVLDEPTASVDAPSEALITDAIDRLRRDRTVIVIAHRLSTVADADRVLVLDDGRVAELGAPDQLRALR